jgi:hypothetical protein
MSSEQARAIAVAEKHGWKIRVIYHGVAMMTRNNADGAFAIGIRPNGHAYSRS